MRGRRAERSYSTFKVRRGSCEEIPLVQGKEQQLRFAGAAVKRYPTPQSRETRDQIVNILWIIKKAREFQKNIYFCFIDYAKAFDCVDYNKFCGKFFK